MIIIFPRESIKKLRYMVKTIRQIILVHLKLNIKKVTGEEQIIKLWKPIENK